MSRLWVRLSAMIAGVLFFVFFLQFLAIVLEPRFEPRGAGQCGAGEGPALVRHGEDETEKAEIARRLIDFFALSAVVGLAGGFLIGRVVSRPVAAIAKAAGRLGSGELSARVEPKGAKELRELALSFNAMAEALEEAERVRKNLVADLSHELRTPLAVLDGSLRAALDGVYPLDEAGIANLLGQTGHLVRLVGELRELTLAEAKKLPLRLEACELSELARDCVQALEPLASDKALRLECRVPGPLVATADPLRVRQILFNLLGNAIRHSLPGGTVLVEGGVETRAEGGRVARLAVVDEGEGLLPGELARVFERFYRADPSRSRETGGSGLGLPIALALAEAQGGSLAAASAGKGGGCTFTLRLPIINDDGAHRATE
ncbi:MAG: HAMP domain-containing protein [Spirochaetaceae bacterium]|nr:HAMP domain-containing protein [Spirochaetaceae bacterium]